MQIKFATSLFIALFIAICCTGQPNGKFEEWGKVSLDDLKVTECSFEKNADRVLLLDLGQIYYGHQEADFFNSGRFLITSAYYQRFKILTEKGTHRADFKITYRSKSKETITDIKAIAYNLLPDGQIEKIELAEKDIYTTQLNQYESEVAFTVPGVKQGSVFEVSYKRTQFLNYTLPAWYFTSSAPSLKSSISIGFLDAIDYYAEEHIKNNDFTKTSEHFVTSVPGMPFQKLNGTTVTYTTLNRPSIPDEPFMNTPRNYMDRVEFQLRSLKLPLTPNNHLISHWAKFSEYLLDKPEFGGNLNDFQVPKKQWKAVINDKMDSQEKLQAIYEMVRQSLNWDGVLAVSPAGTNSKTWKNKSGSSAEINMVLISTLREAGFKVYPMLVGARGSGYIFKDYPIMEQFRSTMAVVELDGQRAILDATNKFLPFPLIPYELLNNYGYVIRSATDNYWCNLFNLGNNHEITSITATLDDNNNLSGTIETTFDNYSMSNFSRMKANGRESAISEQIEKRLPNISIQSINDTINEDRKTYKQIINFSKQVLADNEGKIYISLPDIYGKTTNPFSNKERVSDVDFGYRQSTYTTLKIPLPPGVSVDSLVKPTRVMLSDSSIVFEFDAQVEDNVLTIRQKLEYKKSFYDVEDYPQFYEFHQKYYKRIQQPVVLKRKV